MYRLRFRAWLRWAIRGLDGGEKTAGAVLWSGGHRQDTGRRLKTCGAKLVGGIQRSLDCVFSREKLGLSGLIDCGLSRSDGDSRDSSGRVARWLQGDARKDRARAQSGGPG